MPQPRLAVEEAVLVLEGAVLVLEGAVLVLEGAVARVGALAVAPAEAGALKLTQDLPQDSPDGIPFSTGKAATQTNHGLTAPAPQSAYGGEDLTAKAGLGVVC